MVSLIVAIDKNLGIGKNNNLPWKLKTEMKYFTHITRQNTNSVVIMGRNTWESIPNKFRPLRNRINVIITSRNLNIEKYENTYIYQNIEKSVKELKQKYNKIFVIGGSQLYKYFIENDMVDELYITKIYENFDCNINFLEKDKYKTLIKKYDLINCSEFNKEYCNLNCKDLYFRYYRYKKTYINNKIYKNLYEYQYLNILSKILKTSNKKNDRTGTGTLSVFGEFQEYDLRNTFPLLTTKRMFFRGIFEELMLYLRGQTNNKILNEKGINIWDGNTSRNFLDKCGLTHYKEGDMGETYGFNFRHFGGDYMGCHYDYTSITNCRWKPNKGSIETPPTPLSHECIIIIPRFV